MSVEDVAEYFEESGFTLEMCRAYSFEYINIFVYISQNKFEKLKEEKNMFEGLMKVEIIRKKIMNNIWKT